MKKACIIGFGVSGKAAGSFLLSLGYEVYAVDEKEEKLAEAPLLGVKVLKDPSELQEFSLAILSPGIPPSDPWLQKAQQMGIEVMGEAELALRHFKQRALGITGTNGKTTVTLLVEHILCFSGMKAKALGNVGTALTSYVNSSDPNEVAVIELSSYQLETLHTQALDAAIILNITPDHLDRYPSMQEYAQSKVNIERCLKKMAPLYVYETVSAQYGSLFKEPYFSFGKGLFSHDDINIEAARLLCSYMGVSDEIFFKGLESFRKPSHRIELIRTLEGVSYYDDSKGTNIDGVIQAVSRMQGSTILIAGGVDKGSSYIPWKEAFEGKVKNLFLIGQAASKIQEELGLFFNVQIVDSLADAVQCASNVATEGDSVLLSPGCSSFDMFRDYAHRGQEFQRFVHLLEGRKRE